MAGFFSFGMAFSAYLEWICRAVFLIGDEPARPSSAGLQTFEAQRSSPNPARLIPLVSSRLAFKI